MGVLLSRFRKEQTTEQKLEQLEEKIKKIEEYGLNTQEQKKRFVGTFLAIAVGIYVITVVAIVYFGYFPRTWKERIIYFVPLLIFPFIIFLLRKLFTWHFQRKLNKNSAMLSKLRAEKKEILEQVMDKETYKVAVNLLARFGERNTSNRSSFGVVSRPSTTPQQLRNQATKLSLAKPITSQFVSVSPLQANALNRNLPSPMPSNQISTSSQQLIMSPRSSMDQQLRRRTPFPIVNQAEKSIFERCLDLLIGDGPQDRFAVICSECHSHNGMALKEEFDYIAYRCAFCNALNPARKTRPVAPRLTLTGPSDSDTAHSISRSGESSNSTSETSDEDDDSENSRRYVQQRLTESTGNQSDSPIVIKHESTNVPTSSSSTAIASSTNAATVATPGEVKDSSSVEDTTEPMDFVDNEDYGENQEVTISEKEKKTN